MSDERQETRAAATDEGASVRRSGGLCVRSAVLSSVREDAREADFTCSTDAVDSYGEVVRQNWDLNRFRSNPVALWSHDSHGLPVGQWKDVRVDGGALVGTLKVATAAANPLAENVWQSILEKTLRAVSVGFWPHKVSVEEIAGVERVVLDMNELYEISPTPIPANPEAIGKMKAKAFDEYQAARTKAAATQNPPAPSSAQKEPKMATETENTTKAKDDGEEMSGKVVCPECGKSFKPKGADSHALIQRAVDAEGREKAAAAASDAKIKAADEARVAAEKVLAETREKMLGMQVEADVLPLLGTKLAPAEKDGLVEFGKFCLAKGETGSAQWKNHVEAIKLRGDIAQKTGPGVLPTEPGSGSERSTADASDELVAIVNSKASEARQFAS